VSSVNEELGPFGRSFIGDFPTVGTFSLLAVSFLLSALLSLGNLLPFLLLFMLSSSSMIYISYNFIEPHFNDRIMITRQKALLPIKDNENHLSIGEIGKLLYGYGKSKERWWNLSGERRNKNEFTEFDRASSSNSMNIGASDKIWLSWLILFAFLFIFFLWLIIPTFAIFITLYYVGFSESLSFSIASVLVDISLIGIILLFIYLDGSLNRIREMFYFGSVKRATILVILIPIVVTIIDFILIGIFSFLYFWLFGEPSVNTDIGTTWGSSSIEVILLFLSVAILTPIVEELMFRGYVLDSIQRMHGDKVAILVSALLFGLIHLWPPFLIGSAFIGGLIYGWLRIKTGSLLTPIACHMMWNTMALAVTYL
jgi:membrane protease YdiL (CAAX protease family)